MDETSTAISSVSDGYASWSASGGIELRGLDLPISWFEDSSSLSLSEHERLRRCSTSIVSPSSSAFFVLCVATSSRSSSLSGTISPLGEVGRETDCAPSAFGFEGGGGGGLGSSGSGESSIRLRFLVIGPVWGTVSCGGGSNKTYSGLQMMARYQCTLMNAYYLVMEVDVRRTAYCSLMGTMIYFLEKRSILAVHLRTL